MTEREVARVAAQDVPRSREHHGVEQQIEKCLVERWQPEEWHDREHCGEKHEAGGAAHQNFAGRKRMIAMSNVNDTSGAQVGAVTAIVTASVTPISTPARSGPSALPRPPI